MKMVAILAMLLAPSVAMAGYVGSPAATKAKKAGRKALRELAIDLDGDGREEIAVVETMGSKLRVALFSATGQVDDEHGGFKLITATTPRPGKRVVRLEPMRLVGRAAPELIAVFEDPSPDESALTVIAMGADGGPMREIFSQTFFVPSSKPDTPDVVSFGDASPHYVVEELDAEENGDMEIVWTREPQKLRINDREGKPVTFIIGAYRTVYRYNTAKGMYAVAEEREVVDFLAAKPPYEVKASSQVKEILGTAQAFWGTDGDLETAWRLDRKHAVGETLQVKFERRPDVNLIRVVPGCAKDESAWNTHDRIRKMKIELGSGVRFELDRDRLTDLPPGIRAAAEFPLEDGFGAQLLIFLDRPASLPWARLEILSLEKSRARAKQQTKIACVSELSFH